ncbi:MAG: MerR family transcriptional regulator [Clostridiales Family XIII bacterium]|jgi:DNA-binding transcriptional MerR regulator|nr:MerR family transcriptional regulator [Clostridiales Family XIII bacterium]
MIGKDLLSIKDFSKLTGIKQTTLRYFDDMGLFSPAVRGENSYRYYSPQQIITINSINLLNELDMPIKRICEIERDRTPENIYAVLGDKEDELQAEIHRLQKSYNVITTLRKNIDEGLAAGNDQISIVKQDRQPIVIGDKNDFKGSTYFYDAFLTFCHDAPKKDIDLRLPVGGRFSDFSSFLNDGGRPATFFSVDPDGKDEIPAGKYLVGYARGYYGETAGLPERLDAYIRENNIETDGELYVIYLLDELSIHEKDNYLFKASVKIK